ncbi:MAG: methylenetetrahydrofolate reductase [NAD(P)H] [bacterium]
MKVIEALQSDKPALSFEFFPPKTKEGEESLLLVVKELKKFNPDFVSVTYGALGSTRAKTFWWASEIKNKYGIEPVAHLTCVAADQNGMLEQVQELEKLGIENILALRGDPPAGKNKFSAPANGFSYARELVTLINRHSSNICLGVAGYPEGHSEAPSLGQDIEHLKEKVESGAEFIITQLFFDNCFFFDFKNRCDNAGIRVPIIPGIMPITSVKQLKKMTEMAGASIPDKLMDKLHKHEADPNSIVQIGVEQAIIQCQDLLEAEVPGIHFFVMNQSGPISRILTELKPFRQ